MSIKDNAITLIKIAEKKSVTHDTNLFKFKIPDGFNFDFLPGDHIKIYPNPENPLEFRPYTPVNMPDIKEYFELIIKHYPNGKVSGYMKDRKPGDHVAISGPDTGGHYEDGMAVKVGMVAGGSGITPMISMIRYILQNKIKANIDLLFANKSIEDIILKDEFDKYAENHNNFRRFYILDDPPDGWEMGSGRISAEMMKEKLPNPSPETVIFVCGPPMMQINIKKQLMELGHPKEKVIFP